MSASDRDAKRRSARARPGERGERGGSGGSGGGRREDDSRSRGADGGDGEEDLAATAKGRPAWSRFRAALDAEGFRPSRRLGQNFLLDDGLARAIVRDTELGPADTALEVGSGCGFLSVHLARAVGRLVAVEIDARLARVARRLLAEEPHVELIETDVLASKHAVAPEVLAALPAAGEWHLVGNLPYSVSAPLVGALAELEHPPGSMTVMVQHEVGERFLAPPGGADRGPLAIRLELAYAGRRLRTVDRSLFWPRPRVQSAVVRLVRRPELRPWAERTEIARLAARLFQRRRQSLGRLVGELGGDRARGAAVLERAGIDPRRRPEELALPELAALARELGASSG